MSSSSDAMNTSAADVPVRQPSVRSFTEAVPLSLSSMAHLSVPLEEGVSDGMRQVLQHTLTACLQYARHKYPPHDWTFRDLITSKNAWKATYGGADPSDLPPSLVKLGLKHQYVRDCFIYLSTQGTALDINPQTESSMQDWNSSPNAILGRISLLYASPEMLTSEEMEALNDDDVDIDDMPPTLLYKVLVEYRSLPPSGKTQAVEAEELSMLSFGGSVDDDVKYGALASLYDPTAKYVLEIYSVRGKKYKFDLMDSTLANGTVPRWKNDLQDDPFSKSLCVTVTEHGQASVGPSDAITRMHLTLEGLLRSNDSLDSLPPFTKFPREMIDTFCILDPNRSSKTSATGMPSKQTLLLDPRLAGKVHVNGRLITSWGSDPTVGTHVPALFGVDLLGIPLWHGRIVDYEVFKMEYAQLWQDVLIDARLQHLNIAQKLLYRLIYGQEDSDEGYDDDDEFGIPTTNQDCLESQLMSSAKYDPVGICAKALATHFAAEFGKNAYPCLEHEVEWVQNRMGQKSPVVVPLRLINILKRGGFFDVKNMMEYEWQTEFRVPKGGSDEHKLVVNAIRLLEESGCTDVAPAHVCFVDKAKVTPNPAECLENKSVCRYNDAVRQFYVNDAFLDAELPKDDEDSTMETDSDIEKKKALLLGMYMAQEHPDGNVLVRYLLRHCQKSLGG